MSAPQQTSNDAVQIPQLQIFLGVLFAGALLLANVTASKLAYFSLPLIGGVSVPAGFIAIAVAFLASDCMAEFYGKDYAHTVINATVLTIAIGYGLIWAAISLPVAPFYDAHSAYITTLGASGNIMVASVVTILISQHIDVRVFHAIRERTGENHRWVRNLGSTGFSQMVDTVIFISLSFTVFPMFGPGDPLFGAAFASTIIGQYLVKLVVAVLDTPVFYVVTSARTYWNEQRFESAV